MRLLGLGLLFGLLGSRDEGENLGLDFLYVEFFFFFQYFCWIHGVLSFVFIFAQSYIILFHRSYHAYAIRWIFHSIHCHLIPLAFSKYPPPIDFATIRTHPSIT